MNRDGIVAAFTKVLDDAHIGHRVNSPREGSVAICLGMKVRGKTPRVHAIFEFRQTFLRIYAYSPDLPAAADLGRMLELAARVNFGMVAGCFEVETESAETRFRHVLDFTGLASLPRGLASRTLLLPFQMFQRYGDALAAAAAGTAGTAAEFANLREPAGDREPPDPPLDADGIAAAVKRVLDEEGIAYRAEKNGNGRSVVIPAVDIDSQLGVFSQVAEIRDTCLRTHAVCPLRADSRHVGEMAKFVAMANINLLPGNLDLDPDTGEIRYRLCVDFEGVPAPPDATLRRTLEIPLQVFREYGDAIADVAAGRSDAATALAAVTAKQG
ncbi:MAG: hypothetical protein IK066_08970 [Kiritimatiellae bacterium]|nr:hypothetical protein [Kiritimatiellia bacterium]